MVEWPCVILDANVKTRRVDTCHAYDYRESLLYHHTYIIFNVVTMSVDEQIVLLRQELKIWEKDFATQNGGRKAGREDIKRDPVIGSIYCLDFISWRC